MIVTLAGRKLALDAGAVLGAGGEATVFAIDADRAAKIYHQPTVAHADKLTRMVARAPWPAAVLAPTGLLFDPRGKQVVGCVVPRLPGKFSPFSVWLKKTTRPGVREIVSGLSSLADTLDTLHARGVVVGDLNDQNEQVATSPVEVRLIDADSFQLDGAPCGVGTEAYLDPALYDRDLTASACFSPENDWYALSVLAFRALIGVHPYGGTHPSLGGLMARARARAWVLEPGVRYPEKVALPPRVLGPELLGWFERVFTQGVREPLPLGALSRHASSVVRCPSCGVESPRDLGFCPACTPLAMVGALAPASAGGSPLKRRSEIMIRAGGPVLWVEVRGETIHVFAREGDDLVHYARGGGAPLRRALAVFGLGTRVAVLSDGSVAVASGEQITLFPPRGETPRLTTTTETFDGVAVVAALGAELVRISGGMIVRGTPRGSSLVERPLGPALAGQTWLASSGSGTVLVGANRLFRHVLPFRLGVHGRIELEVPKLIDDEALLEICVVAEGEETLVLRRTASRGAATTRLDLLGKSGHLAASSLTRSDASPVRADIRGRVFRGTTVLHPTDDGLVHETVTHGAIGPVRIIPDTRAHVSEHSLLATHPAGLLVTDGWELLLLHP